MVVRVLSGNKIPLPPFNLNLTVFLPQLYLILTSFLPHFNLNLTSASLGISNLGFKTTVYRPLEFLQAICTVISGDPGFWEHSFLDFRRLSASSPQLGFLENKSERSYSNSVLTKRGFL